MPKQPHTIFHAFNWLLSDIGSSSYDEFIKELYDDGFDAIQISPLQESFAPESRDWYYRYQPMNHLVISGLGNQENLKELCEVAQGYDMTIIADVVFNHMAVLIPSGRWQKANESKENGFPEEIFSLYEEVVDKLLNLELSDIREWSSMNEGYEWDEAPYRIIGFGNDEWIDLRPTRNVISIHKKHLDILTKCGVKGFRFDAIKHIDPWQFKTYVNYINKINPNAWVYGEVLSQDENLHKKYQTIAPLTDFHLTQQVHDAFSYGGNLKNLAVPKILGHFCTRFARNHDTILNKGFDNYKYSTYEDAQLAWAYILSIAYGTILVFDSDYKHNTKNSNIVKYGVKFREKMISKNAKEHYILDNKKVIGVECSDLLIIQRGKDGFVIINKSDHSIDYPIANFTESELDGNYKELQFRTNVKIKRASNGQKYVSEWGSSKRGGIEIGKRTVLYFYHT